MEDDTQLSRLEMEAIQCMGIHNLRSFARQIGVKSPTTLKKSELIDLIVKIKTGQIEPSKTNMGRKPKPMSNFDYTTIQPDPRFDGTLILNAPTSEFDAKTYIRDGVLKFLNNSAPIIKIVEKSNQVITIPFQPSLIAQYNMKQNDVVRVEIVPIVNSYMYSIRKIISINGIDIEKYDSDKFTLIKSMPNNFDFFRIDYGKYSQIIGDGKIYKGTFNYFYYPDPNNIVEYAYDFCKTLKNDDNEIILLNANAFVASQCNLPNDEDIQVYNLDADASYEEQEKQTKLILEKVKNDLVEGKSVVWVITELDEIFKIVNYNMTNVVGGEISPDSVTAMRKICRSAKYVDRKQNSTVVCFSSMSVKGNYQNAIVDDILSYSSNYMLPRK